MVGVGMINKTHFWQEEDWLHMIVRITFLDGDKKPLTMLFGNSYKRWEEQVQDYLRLKIQWWDVTKCTKRELFGITKVETCRDEWIAWGGLKWCAHEDFQHLLDREGCQSGEADNPMPRKYSNMVFGESQYVGRKAREMYKTRIRHLGD